MMNIYLLEAKEGVGWDSYDSFVVAAMTLREARVLANTHAACEGHIWTIPRAVKGTLIGVNEWKRPKVILGSFNAG